MNNRINRKRRKSRIRFSSLQDKEILVEIAKSIEKFCKKAKNSIDKTFRDVGQYEGKFPEQVYREQKITEPLAQLLNTSNMVKELAKRSEDLKRSASQIK